MPISDNNVSTTANDVALDDEDEWEETDDINVNVSSKS